MILIVCVDDEMGMAFNGRRQSRDRVVCRDMAALADGEPILMSERSLKLFEGMEGRFHAEEGGMERAGAGEFCFIEFEPVEKMADRAEKIILYRWNRRYPADLYCSIPLETWNLKETTEFPGYSHELITREVYVRER